jgi:two-component system chemotaxis response regulator CheY
LREAARSHGRVPSGTWRDGNQRRAKGVFVKAGNREARMVDPAIVVLVVDESAAASRIIVSLVEQAGFSNVGHVPDGQSALERLRAGNISLVLADWRMSPMSGLELLRRIRQDAAMKAVRFVLMTASAHPQLPETVQSLGANGFLRKPCTAEALRQTIEQAFASERS